MKMWKKQLRAALLLHSDSFLPKAPPNPLSCCYKSRKSAKTLCWSILENWNSDTENSLAALTTAVTNTVASGFIYRRTTSLGRKKKQRKKTQQNQQPFSPSKAISHLFVYGKFCSKRWEQNAQQTSRVQKALRARAAWPLRTRRADGRLLEDA